MRTGTHRRRQREKIHLEPVTPALLNEVVDRIVRAVAPERIILFGSHARGTPREYSDLDLLVVKAGVTRPMEVAEEIYGLFWDKAIAIDVRVSSPGRLERELKYGNSFVRTQILKSGKVLYDRSAAVA